MSQLRSGDRGYAGKMGLSVGRTLWYNGLLVIASDLAPVVTQVAHSGAACARSRWARWDCRGWRRTKAGWWV